MYISRTIVKVFVGCCASAFLMEILMAQAPNNANLVTFLQFFFIALQGFIFTSKFGTIRPKIPLRHYTLLVALFFVTSVSNNYVYVLHVPSTLHMIIRSASSPASMIVSWIAKKQAPKITKCIGSALISMGVALAMYGGATIAEQNEGEFMYWCIGVVILLSTLFLGALTGLQQEILFAKYGKHPEEMLFYTYALPLPLFLGIYPQLQERITNSTMDMWFIIALSIVSQFYCTHSVHELATKEPSVTVTFILTLRKFVSLLISSFVFKNNLTVLHVIGTVFVGVGTYVYFDFFAQRRQQPVSMKDKSF
ncbi:UDP-xylose and UDP-N-acetylglucosamine transporter-like [Pectinophora gossypiella]|uniref:UDP-xylose and UDP-N-acetylglucosamine transporter-like n=1 Tax=Pectinophora gossypiella TaxID=13191 RepID=UPI00214F3219|nr:UDP-xylose and UDP-N-acetylglucosamine transporter-like [Pectinophora gossypiella]